MREAAIQIEQVSKSFQGREVLKNISCELNWGQVYGIVGNNGSGKTVLMKCICGLLPYDEGSIRVNGKKIGKDVDFPEDMGMIIESPGFLPGLTAVSYTHLRAHETLANLVCRLLLEKIFFNDTATTEIYTLHIVGSVRCV